MILIEIAVISWLILPTIANLMGFNQKRINVMNSYCTVAMNRRYNKYGEMYVREG